MILNEERRIKEQVKHSGLSQQLVPVMTTQSIQEKVAAKIAKAKEKREYSKKSGKKTIADEVEVFAHPWDHMIRHARRGHDHDPSQ